MAGWCAMRSQALELCLSRPVPLRWASRSSRSVSTPADLRRAAVDSSPDWLSTVPERNGAIFAPEGEG